MVRNAPGYNTVFWAREDRAIREEELAGDAALIDAFETDFTGHSTEELQVPLLFHREGSRMPKPCASMAKSESHFRNICGSAAGALLSIPNVVFAGSSVLSAFLDESSDESFPPSDIDMFLVSDDAAAGEAALRLVYEALQGTAAEKNRLLILRSSAAVTLFRSNGTPIQVVLHMYKSVAELLTAFDVDCCCIAFDPAAKKLWCTRRPVFAQGRRASDVASFCHLGSREQKRGAANERSSTGPMSSTPASLATATHRASRSTGSEAPINLRRLPIAFLRA